MNPVMEFRRRLYRRGSSFETTIPMPLLLTLDPDARHDVVFAFDPATRQWVVRFDPRTPTSVPKRLSRTPRRPRAGDAG